MYRWSVQNVIHPSGYTCMHVCIVVQMKKATTNEELRSLCLKDDNVQFIMDAGYSRPLTFVSITDKDRLLSVVTKHYTLLRNKADLDQLREGLSALGIGKMMAEHPDMMEPFFVYERWSCLLVCLSFRVCGKL